MFYEVFYELTLTVVDKRRSLGWFQTKNEAEQALCDAQKYYGSEDGYLQEMLRLGLAGYEITEHTFTFGLTPGAQSEIRHGKLLHGDTPQNSESGPVQKPQLPQADKDFVKVLLSGMVNRARL